MRTLKQKEIKNFKKEIVEYGASSNGYWESIFSKMVELDNTLFFEKIDELHGWGFENLSTDYGFQNALVTEFVKDLKYQEFKELMPYFLGWQNPKLKYNLENNSYDVIITSYGE